MKYQILFPLKTSEKYSRLSSVAVVKGLTLQYALFDYYVFLFYTLYVLHQLN